MRAPTGKRLNGDVRCAYPQTTAKASRRSREDATETFSSLATVAAVPLVNRLHLNWHSIPASKQAKLYSPSTTQLPLTGNNRPSGLPSTSASSNKHVLSPIEPSRTDALSALKRSQTRSAAVAAFEQKYAAEDPLMRYVLDVIRTGSPVRRSDIPRGKHIQRRVRPEEDVLYLVYCKAPPCGFGNVYWLRFADEGTILRNDQASALEYFTLGSHGLTRFKGGQGVEFSELASWVDEKHAFDSMTNMKGLKRIQQMIFFFSWKRQAVQRRLHRVRERLASSLFFSHPVARQLLLNVRDVCAEIEDEAEREYVEADTSYTLERLDHIYRERVREAKSAITKRIQALCVAIDEATRDISRYKEDQGRGYAITDQEAFSKALRLSSLRERIFTFLRLVDCHVAEAVYQHVTLVVRDLRRRICGQPGAIQYVGAEERRGRLCRSDLSEDASGSTPPDQIFTRVNYTTQAQTSDKSVVAVPGVYVSLEDDVSFEGDVHSAAIHFVPTKVEVLELVHVILMKYCIAMDGLPRVLTDRHFEYVLTPFVPSTRRDFAESLLKPSHLALESYEPELRAMRAALEKHFRRLRILQQEHLRCVRAIKVAERESPVETTRRNSITDIAEVDEEDGRLPELPDLSSSAAAYELAQKTWGRFVRYANSAAPMLQVGYLLLDQRSFVDRLRSHVSKRVAEMDDALPLIYQQFLTSLLEDVDGRIEKITKIPTNLEEANAWLTQVTSMMPSRPFRQRLDTKIANLARLKTLIKERGLTSLEPEVQDTIRKLELTWESVIETLLVCLARVEERGSEHRRSVHDVITKVDEYVSIQLQQIIKMFDEIPSGCEEEHDDGVPSSTALLPDKDDLLQQLEDLVAMDIERKNVVQQFEEYDREHRAVMDMPPVQQPVWTSSLSSTNSENLSAVSMTDKLPSELLLLYIITSLELRHWFESWKKMQDKWLGAPLTGVHPGTMINRIKQFRRRLGYASSRLSRLSSVLQQTLFMEANPSQHEDDDRKDCASFANKDFQLMRVFDSSIEEMSNCNRIFQAISGGAFSDARWATMNQLLNVKDAGSNGGSHLTLRLMKETCEAGQIEAFLDVCDECIVEAKLHVKLEQARQRLTRIEVRVEEANYSVRCEGIAEALAQLDEIAVDVNLCLFGQNPELQLCLELRTDLEHKVAMCEHILLYQKHWRLRCEATKLHEMDEFFSKRFSGGDFAVPRAQKSHQKAGLKQEQSVWQAFLDASHAWTDRLRRLFFVSPLQVKVEQVEKNQRSLMGRKSAVSSAPMTLNRRLNTATKSMGCTLDDVMKSFEGFDFEANFAACERGVELVLNYLNSIREKAPRLYCLDESAMLRLLLRDSDVKQLHQSLAICFPRVHRFAVSRAANRVGSAVEVFGKPESSVRASKTDGTIVILGIEGMQDHTDTTEKSGHFRLPVTKIGRVKFWFSRLEEEMGSIVLTDLKRAFEWATQDLDGSEFGDYVSLLPQSIATAFGLRFTFEMNQALRLEPHETMCHQLRHLQVSVRGRMENLVTMCRAEKASTSPRLENMLLLSAMQSEIVDHIIQLVGQGQQEAALFFWSMQFQTRIYVETMTSTISTVQLSPGKHSKLERNELLPSSPDFLKVTSSNHSGQATSFSVCCQVAHLQMPLGQEFVGWQRQVVLSPFTQRCSYALFSSLRMRHTALVVPYNADRAPTDPSTSLWSISQILLRPCVEFACDPNAGIVTVHQLGNMMSFTTKLNGFLIVRHLLLLSAALVGVVQKKLLQHSHQASPVGSLYPHHPQQAATKLLVLPRQSGGFSYGASGIFIPLESTEELQRSGLVQSIRSKFRAVAVSRPAIKYFAECMLIADGFTPEQTRELNVVQAFETIDAGEAGSTGAFTLESLISRVIREARRLRGQYRVVWDLNPLIAADKVINGQFQASTETSAASKMEIREGQFIFRQACLSAIKTLLIEGQDGGENTAVDHVLARVFPLSMGGRLETKHKGDEEAVAAAVTIYLESAFALPTDSEHFELVMELWRALQTFPAALVYGSPGSGKTTCITALHRALVALELSEQNQENEEMCSLNRQVNPSPTQLVILNPHLLTLDQFYSNIATACGADDAVNWNQSSSPLKWVLVDGEVDGGVLDRLLECDNRACSSASSLPSSSVLYRGQSSTVMSGDYSDSSDSPRLLFEVTSVANLSPSALRRCWALYVPRHCITVTSIIRGWRSKWENQLIFPSDSRGFEAMTVVFRTVDVLISSICVRFAIEEAAPEVPNTAGLKLGFLSLNHVTQTALTMVSLCCLQSKSLLQELSYIRLVELVALAVLWGFAGHLTGASRIKLENFVRARSKEHSETKHLADLQRSLLDTNYFADVWDELQPRFAAPITVQPAIGVTNGAKAEAKMESAFDASSGQVLVLVPASVSLVRVCSLLLHSSHSFLLVGPAASGKTSLLRWLMHRNREAEAARMKIETSLDDRHVHDILDWTCIPGAWFRPLDQRDSDVYSRAKMREESELFATRSRHSFVFLDDLDASGEIADNTQVEFIRTMLDHRVGYSTKHGGFHSLEKRIGAGMRLNDSSPSFPSILTRFMRHFVVLRAPTYTQKELLSVFRIKFQQHFNSDVAQAITERRFSAEGDMGGGGQQLPLEEVVLRASVDFAAQMAAFQLLGDKEHPCLVLFNLHHVNMLLERTLVFASSLSASNTSSEGTTLVQLGKAHQSWLSELKNVFLSNCPPLQASAQSSQAKVASKVEPSDGMQKKILTLIRHLSEKYFSVAFRANAEHIFTISVETLHFLVKLAEGHTLAPLLQPRLVQLRELLYEQMTAANGVSRRSSDQARGSVSGFNSLNSPAELVSSILLEIAATSTSMEAEAGHYDKTCRPYSSGQLTRIQTKLLLCSSWCLTQVTHLIHALSQQQIVLCSSSRHGRLLADRLLRFACDLHGFKVHMVDFQTSDQELEAYHKQVIRSVLGAAAVRQERVALWIRERQIYPHARCLLDIIQELCLGKLPSLAMLPGGEELRDELVLSCIQSRKQLDIVTEAELMAEFQQRLQQNLRLCILEESNDERSGSEDQRDQKSAPSSDLFHWMKTRPSCHWRRLEFAEFELQRFIPETAQAALISPTLCGIVWDVQQVAKYANMCQNAHLLMMRAPLEAADASSQLDYFLSFMTNVTVTYRAKMQSRQKKTERLRSALETLAFARDKVVPTLEHLKQEFELQCAHIDNELEGLQEVEMQQIAGQRDSLGDESTLDPEVEEARWILQSRYEELKMLNTETKARLEEVLALQAEWHHVAERLKDLFTKWTLELGQEQCETEHSILAVAVYVSALRVYPHVTSLPKGDTCVSLLCSLILENIVDDNSHSIENRLEDASIDDSEDENIDVMRLIWTSRFLFLRNPGIYRTIRLADVLCDRVPVIVDPSGVLQRFLVHFFSGHTLFSTFSGCGGPGEFENENPSESKKSLVISCDDSKLEDYLHEALRLGIPVLLVNFRSADLELVDRLQPFLDQTRLSHAAPRRSMLRELTMGYYEDQRRQRQRRTSNTGSTMETTTSFAPTVASGAISMARRAVRASKLKMTIDPASVAAAVSALSATSSDHMKPLDRRDARRRSQVISGNTSNGHNFQIYAVTDTPVPLEVQHSLAAQFAHFSVSLLDSDLETLLELPRVGKTEQTLLQELRDDQIGLADYWMKKNLSRGQLHQLLSTLKPAVDHDDSPFASRKANRVTIQLQERYSELAVQLANEHHAELKWTSRQQNFQAKTTQLKLATEMFAPMALQLVGVGRCMATMSSSFTIGTRATQFYLQNFHYLENAITQQLAVQGDDNTQLSAHGLAALLVRISSGFVSASHRQIFYFLELIRRQIRASSDEPHSQAWKEAIVWIVSSHVRRSRTKETSSRDLQDASSENRQGLGIFPRRNSVNSPGDTSASLVERLRRRVKLCAHLFNGWMASRGGNNVRGKSVKAQRPLDGRALNKQHDDMGKPDNNSGCRELVIEQLQQKLDKLLADSETLWYEWKTTKLRLLLDVELLISNLGCREVLSSSAVDRNNCIFPSAITLVTLEELSARFKVDATLKVDDVNTARQQALVRLLLAKTFFPSSFAHALAHYSQVHDSHACSSEPDSAADNESANNWTAWPSPASLVVGIAPPRGKYSRAHLPRALIIYLPGERSNVELKFSCWSIATFEDTSGDSVAFREELIMLITTKHKFVLELLDARQVESALSLVSKLINEHALLSVPEWYVLASFAVATAIQNGKLAVMDRIAVVSSSSLSHLDFVDRGRRGTEQTVRHKLMEEYGASESEASVLTLAVLSRHRHVEREATSSVVRDLDDVVLHLSSIEEVAIGTSERELMTNNLLQLVKPNDPDCCVMSRSNAVNAAILSSELLNDLVSISNPSLALLTEGPEEEWLPRHSITNRTASCDQLWAIFHQVRDLFEALQTANTLPIEPSTDVNGAALFFPWQSFDSELATHFSAFEAIYKHLALLRTAVTSTRQQQLSSLARGYVPFEWIETFFTGTAWPPVDSGIVSISQLSLLIACRVGVLVRCICGDRAWALNLAVVNNAHEFLRCLRSYNAAHSGVSESSLMFTLELDSTGTTEGDVKKKKKVLAIAKQFGAMLRDKARESDWHGAVLRHSGGGVQSWGIRVEGLVLITATKMHPLPVCRILCQPRADALVEVEAPLVLLPSLSLYQPAPIFSQEAGNADNGVCLVLGQSINSVVDMKDNLETTQYAVGVPVFPDDDSNDTS